MADVIKSVTAYSITPYLDVDQEEGYDLSDSFIDEDGDEEVCTKCL